MNNVDYEIYAFRPDAIATFRPQRHQTRTQEAKELATRMLEAGPVRVFLKLLPSPSAVCFQE